VERVVRGDNQKWADDLPPIGFVFSWVEPPGIRSADTFRRLTWRVEKHCPAHNGITSEGRFLPPSPPTYEIVLVLDEMMPEWDEQDCWVEVWRRAGYTGGPGKMFEPGHAPRTRADCEYDAGQLTLPGVG